MIIVFMYSNIYSSITMTGNQLKELREEELEMTQLELALALGKAPGTVARWEQQKNNEIPDSRFLELAIEGLKAEMKVKGKGKK
jgi:transcriptional regulator with XRE-family HTH domain